MIVRTLYSLIEPHKDPARAEYQGKYLRDQFPFLGVRTPQLRKAVQSLKGIYPSIDWREEVKEFWRQPDREFHLAAIYWAIAHRKKAVPEDLSFYEDLITSHSWWDTVDTIAPHLVGALLHRFPELLQRTEEWLESDQLWLKRTALIYPLYNRKQIDSERLFRYCSHLSQDTDFFIRKAIGWVLRELSKTNPAAVAEYLKTTRLSPLSTREAGKHLPQKKS